MLPYTESDPIYKHLRWERLGRDHFTSIQHRFRSTLPYVGSDQTLSIALAALKQFQSTLPYAGNDLPFQSE